MTVHRGEAPALELDGLCKIFGDRAVVDDVRVTVPTGSFHGIVGPNGAGKTTALSMAVGLVRPDAGTSRVAGHDVWTEPGAALAAVGVLLDELPIADRLAGREALVFLGRLRGLPPDTIAERVDDLLGVLDLTAAADTPVGGWSTGMRKKLGLASALLHTPRVLVLDEPFEAVDPVAALTVRAILARYVAGGGTVVLSSHSMALVEQMCDGVTVLAEGRVVADGPMARVRGDGRLEDVFVDLVGARPEGRELSWLTA